MGKHHKVRERLDILNDYFNSNLSISEYARQHDLAKTTLLGWIHTYKEEFGDPAVNGFYNITSIVKTNEVIASQGIIAKDEITTSISCATEITTNTIKIKHPSGVELEFDVSILERVVKAIL
jgi:transposase-like protein